MGPMNDAPFFVPFVFAEDSHFVAILQAPHSRRQVNIVSDEQRFARFQRHDEPLVPAAVVVIGQYSHDGADCRDLDT